MNDHEPTIVYTDLIENLDDSPTILSVIKMRNIGFCRTPNGPRFTVAHKQRQYQSAMLKANATDRLPLYQDCCNFLKHDVKIGRISIIRIKYFCLPLNSLCLSSKIKIS